MQIKRCVDDHRELMQRPDVQLGLDYALGQMMWDKSHGVNTLVPVDGNAAAANYYMLLGAHEFIRVFKSLAESPQIIPPPPTDPMDHKF